MRAIGRPPRRKTSKRSRLATLFGIRIVLPSIVRTLIDRQESCSTRPMVSPERTMSPTWTVRSSARATPEKRLPSVSWRARPTTAVMTADVASSAGRLAERIDLKEYAERDAEENEADDLAQQIRRRGAALEAVADVEHEEVGDAGHDEGRGEPDDEGAVVPFLRVRNGNAEAREQEHGPEDQSEEGERRQDPARPGDGDLGDADGHRAASRSAAARGLEASWKSRIAAMPEIRSR